MLIRPIVGAALAAGLLTPAPTAPRTVHELQDNRATLVLRGGALLAVSLHINYADALHRTLAPQLSMGDFLAMSAAMPPAQFRAALERAQTHFRHGVHVVQAGGRDVTLDNWEWPDAAQVQAMLQQLAMEAIVAPQDQPHESPLEIRADGVVPGAVGKEWSVQVRFPDEFQRVLVVWYKAKQAWSAPQDPSPVITFR